MASPVCKKTIRVQAYLRCEKSASEARKKSAAARVAAEIARQRNEDAAKAAADKIAAAAQAKVAQVKATKAAATAKKPKATPQQKATAKKAVTVAKEAKAEATTAGREATKAAAQSRKASEVAKVATVRAKKAAKTASKKPGSDYAGDTLAGIKGDNTTILTTSASCLHHEAAQYRLTEISQLRPSHDGMTFRKTAGYPAGVQERRYSTDKAEQAKVIGNAQASCFEPAILANTDPTPIGGPPIVSPSGIVLGGNSRAMVLQRIYRNTDRRIYSSQHSPAATEYRRELSKNAKDWGFSKADVASLDEPVLVRVVNVKASLKGAVRRYNEALTQSLDQTAEQVATAARIDAAVVSELSNNLGSDESLTDFLKSSRSAGLVKLLVQKGVITRQRQNALIAKNGRLNDDGRRFLGRALVGRILQDADALDLLFRELPSLRENLARAVPSILAAAAVVDKGKTPWDITTVLPGAVLLFSAVRSSGSKDVQAYMKQSSLFSSGVQVTTATALLASIFMERNGPLRLSSGFKKYAGAARQTETFDMFAEPKTPVEALGAAFNLPLLSGPQVIAVTTFDAPRASAKKPKAPVSPPASVATAKLVKVGCKPDDQLPPGRRQYYVDVTNAGVRERWCVVVHFGNAPAWVVVGTYSHVSPRTKSGIAHAAPAYRQAGKIQPFGWFKSKPAANKAIAGNVDTGWSGLRIREAKETPGSKNRARSAPTKESKAAVSATWTKPPAKDAPTLNDLLASLGYVTKPYAHDQKHIIASGKDSRTGKTNEIVFTGRSDEVWEWLRQSKQYNAPRLPGGSKSKRKAIAAKAAKAIKASAQDDLGAEVAKALKHIGESRRSPRFWKKSDAEVLEILADGTEWPPINTLSEDDLAKHVRGGRITAIAEAERRGSGLAFEAVTARYAREAIAYSKMSDRRLEEESRYGSGRQRALITAELLSRDEAKKRNKAAAKRAQDAQDAAAAGVTEQSKALVIVGKNGKKYNVIEYGATLGAALQGLKARSYGQGVASGLGGGGRSSYKTAGNMPAFFPDSIVLPVLVKDHTTADKELRGNLHQTLYMIGAGRPRRGDKDRPKASARDNELAAKLFGGKPPKAKLLRLQRKDPRYFASSPDYDGWIWAPPRDILTAVQIKARAKKAAAAKAKSAATAKKTAAFLAKEAATKKAAAPKKKAAAPKKAAATKKAKEKRALNLSGEAEVTLRDLAASTDGMELWKRDYPGQIRADGLLDRRTVNGLHRLGLVMVWPPDPESATLRGQRGLVKIAPEGLAALDTIDRLVPSEEDRSCLRPTAPSEVRYHVDISHRGKVLRWCRFTPKTGERIRWVVVATMPAAGQRGPRRMPLFWAQTKKKAARYIDNMAQISAMEGGAEPSRVSVVAARGGK